MTQIIELVVLFFIVFCIIALIAYKTRNKGGQIFDEMQLINRGNAYKYAMFTSMISLLIFACLFGLEDLHFANVMDPCMAMFTALYLSIAVFACYAIAKDSFFHVNDKKRSYPIVCVIVILANLPSFFTNEPFKDGKFSFSSGGSAILNVSLFAIILIAFGIKKIATKMEDEES